MRVIEKAAIAAAFLGSMACSNPVLAQKQYNHLHHRYWHRYWGSPYGYTYRYYNPDLYCTLDPAGWTAVQGGVCRPYRGY